MLTKKEPAPARKKAGGIDWPEAVATMKASPGEFHLLGEYSTGVASALRKGVYKAFLPDGVADPAQYMSDHWEFTSRTVKKGAQRVSIFGRFVG